MLKRSMIIPAIWIVVLILWALPALADMIVDTAWVRRHNAGAQDTPCAIAVDGCGNVYVTGSVYRGYYNNYDYLTIRYYANGDTAWTRSETGWDNGNDSDYPHDLAVDNFGNLHVAGEIYHKYHLHDYFMIKYDSLGTEKWRNQWDCGANNDRIYSIILDQYGKVYVTGRAEYMNGAFSCYETIKADSGGGSHIWREGYTGPKENVKGAYAIAVDNLGHVYVTGGTYQSDTTRYYDITTLKYYPDGGLAWDSTYNGPADTDDVAYDLTLDSAGNVYVTGCSFGIGTSTDYVTIKYQNSGNIAWVRRYNGESNAGDTAKALAVDDSGNVYVSGWAHNNGTYADYVTIKYDPSGDPVWVRRYNGPGNFIDRAYALELDRLGNVYVTGYSWGLGTDADFATIKYYPNGDTAWIIRYNGTADSDDGAVDIAVDTLGHVYVTGYSYGSGTAKDYVTVKYSQGLRGDANGDGQIDIADVVYLINYLFIDGPAPDPLSVGNANCDDVVNIADVVYLINYLFIGGPPPDC
jgi:uncharacterized delta-60 repeat protein